MPNRVKTALLAGVALSISLVVSLALAESTIRAFRPAGDLQPDSNVIRSLVPNVRKEVRSFDTPENLEGLSESLPDEPIHVGWTSTNNLGFRMTSDVGPKRPEERRILLLGDSYLEARQVDAPDRFAEIVSARLTEETNGRWTLLNAGIRSASPLQFLMQLHHWGDELGPDIVIAFVGANDIPDDIRTARRYGVVNDENGFPARPEKQWSLWLIQHSQLARFMVRYTLFRMPDLFALLSGTGEPRGPAAPGFVHAWIELACEASESSKQLFMDGTGRYLRMLRDFTGRMGAGFAVVLVHYPFYFPDEPFYEERWDAGFLRALEEHGCAESGGRAYEAFGRDFLRRNGIEFASTHGEFMEAKKRNPRQKLWNFYDYHYNVRGHQLAADVLHGLVRKMIAESEREAALADRAPRHR